MARRLLIIVMLLLALVGCSDDDEGSPPARTIGLLRSVASPRPGAEAAFLDELAEAGWVEGQNLTVLGLDPQETHRDDAPETVRGWLDEGVDLIVALSTSTAKVAAVEAPDVPVLFLVNDPTVAGLVDNERRPGGHLTGVTYRVPADRTLDVALRAIGELDSVGLLWPSEDPAAPPVRDDVRRAGAALDVTVVDEPFGEPEDVDAAFDRLAASGVPATILANAPSTLQALDSIAAAAQRVGMPLVSNTQVDHVVVALTPDSQQLYRQLGRQAVRLLRGAAVHEVPVEDPAGFRIVVNREVAERQGIELPQELLELADEVVG